MSITVYDSLIYLGVVFGIASAVVTLTGFIGRDGWSRNRLVLFVVIGMALCSVSLVCIVWSIAMDTSEGDFQSLIDTVPYWAVCSTVLIAFDVFVG